MDAKCRVCYDSKFITCYNCNGDGYKTETIYKFRCIKKKIKMNCLLCNSVGKRSCVYCCKEKKSYLIFG